VLSDFIQQSACPVAGFKALGMPPHFAVTPPGEHHPSFAIRAKIRYGRGCVSSFLEYLPPNLIWTPDFTPEIKWSLSDFEATTIIFGDHACLVITQAPLIFSILVICSGSYLCWRRCGCSQSHPEKIYKLFEFAAREHACDFVTRIGIILNSVSTLVPPVSFGSILDDGFVISDPNAI